MNDFIGIGIVGIFLSVVMEYITTKFGTTSITGRALVIGLSVVFGLAYTFFSQTIWWSTVLGVLASASTVYALVYKS